jgi:hypothetical protein
LPPFTNKLHLVILLAERPPRKPKTCLLADRPALHNQSDILLLLYPAEHSVASTQACCSDR